jgi:hypothetical protein
MKCYAIHRFPTLMGVVSTTIMASDMQFYVWAL